MTRRGMRRTYGPRYEADLGPLARQAFGGAWKPTHRQLERLVIEVAKGLGWRVHAIHDSRREDWAAASGWPDLFMVRDDGARAVTAVLEVKVPPDDVTDEQRAWLVALSRAGIRCGVFRSNLDRGTDMAAAAAWLNEAWTAGLP